MTRCATIEIAKEDMHFSAAHFTIFSAAQRENLHGHDFSVAATATGPLGDDGLCFDYNALKRPLRALCETLDEVVLLPLRSPHLQVREEPEGRVTARFADELLTFLRRDVRLLPVRNVTVEELAAWFAERLAADADVLALPIESLTVRVSSGPGQWAGVEWKRPRERPV